MTDCVLQVPVERWTQAQRFEIGFAVAQRRIGDDWNHWWADKFDGYSPLRNQVFENVLEVGCGPNTNARLVVNHIVCSHLYLEDPLMQGYLRFPNHLWGLLQSPYFRVSLSSSPVESLPYREAMMDLVICINVLGHVQDFNRALSEIDRVLRPGGVLILGEDLTNDEDLELCPEVATDVGHPIRFDGEAISQRFEGYESIYEVLLPRERGRNPQAHYATLAGIYRKVGR